MIAKQAASKFVLALLCKPFCRCPRWLTHAAREQVVKSCIPSKYESWSSLQFDETITLITLSTENFRAGLRQGVDAERREVGRVTGAVNFEQNACTTVAGSDNCSQWPACKNDRLGCVGTVGRRNAGCSVMPAQDGDRV